MRVYACISVCMTEPKPTPFNIKLDQDDRERLERIRIDLGLRSHADAIRALIRGWAGPAQKPPQLGPVLGPLTGRVPDPSEKPSVSVPLAGTFDRKPMQKGTKK